MDKLSLWKERVEERLSDILEKLQGPPSLKEAVKYYPLQKGKRIRPLFTVAVASTLGGNEEDAITVGCAIELIHNYSLIHDDLPCMDNDAWRRGQPTCHIKFGEALALLAGDALLTYTFEVLSDKNNFKTLGEGEILEIINVISKKSGSDGMVGGQVLDIEGYENLYEVSIKKTGALFEACFVCGGIVAGRRDILGELEETGRKVGLLFQMVDDYLDKDGFYTLKGEELKKDIEELYGVILEKEILRKSEELRKLLEMIKKRVD
ncbi:polyprenyl synthetase family protein [Aquifex pyrophilus]